VCGQCIINASESAASVGAGFPGLMAAGASALGLRRLSVWLTVHDFHVLTPKRVKIVTPILVWAIILALFSVRY
jgi:hypothetical protein